MDYTTLHLISSVYSMQEIYRALGFQLLQSMMNTASLAAVVGASEGREIPNDLYKDHMALIVQTEQVLMDEYAEVLRQLK